MKRYDLNKNWRWRRLGEGTWQEVTLPHDAMLCERRSPTSAGGADAAWFEGADYEYERTVFLPEEGRGHTFVLEFGGVYRNAEIFLNGEKVASRAYGYTGFALPLALRVGENVLRVVAHNRDLPSCRWYSGAGIYRPVSLWTSDGQGISFDGVRLETLSTSPAVLRVRVKTDAEGEVCARIYDDKDLVAEAKGGTHARECTLEIPISDAKLWTAETPNLYCVLLTFGEDSREEYFGLRTLSCSAKEGLLVNGKRVILRGACVHHDNGLLGACSDPEAEERKVRILKACGYNAVRCAHNPCAEAFLDACDRLGLYVMDEYADMWYIHKTKYDYACDLAENWRADLADMVRKDYDHPSVILYSVGNETAETAEARGVELLKSFHEELTRLDGTRPVTCGINPWFNAMHRMGFGQYSDRKAEKRAKGGRHPAVGSEFFNRLAGIVGAGFMKRMACLPLADRVTRDAYAVLDVAGYNYGIRRYAHDIGRYPDRVLVGSETFCADAYAFFEFAKTHPALIGDFVWSGIDYLGEAGVGSWEYREYAPDFSHGAGWMTAGSGRADLIGTLTGEALYTRIAFGLDEGPYLAVSPVNHTGERHSPSAWKFSNAIPSWSWRGCAGKKAHVEVYSRAPAVELLLNGRRVGYRKFGKNCRFDFRITYEDGELTAIARDREGRELSRSSLKTAGEETVLSVTAEGPVRAGGLAYLRLQFTDAAGNVKPLEHRKVRVRVEGAALLALGCAAPYNEIGYTSGETDTYYGEAMAVVRAQEGPFTLHVTDGTLETSQTFDVQ